MSDKQTLLDLADRVEAGEGLTDGELYTALWDNKTALREAHHTYNVTAPALRSLDAAKVLHDAVLPGWIYTINWYRPTTELSARVSVARTGGVDDFEGKAPTAAAAWVAAILKGESGGTER